MVVSIRIMLGIGVLWVILGARVLASPAAHQASSPAHALPPFEIALDADLSAVAAEGGMAIARGASIAIDEINASGGLLGRQLVLKLFDHRGNPARGRRNIEAIAKREHVLAVLGGVHTPVAIQELPLLHKHQLIYLGPWAAGTSLVDNGYQPNYVFRVSVRDQEAGKVLIGHAKKAGHKRVALLLENTVWGRSNEASLSISAAAQGIEITSIEWVNWRQQDMTAELTNIHESGATAVILVANAPEGAVATFQGLTCAQRLKLEVLPIYSHWGVAGGKFVSAVGLGALNAAQIYVLQSYSFLRPSNTARNEQVLQSYQGKFAPDIQPEAIPGAVGVANAYELVHMLALAVKKAQSSDRAKIRDAMEQLENVDGLIRFYPRPFSPARHDALWAPDYFMSRYNEQGHLVPSK